MSESTSQVPAGSALVMIQARSLVILLSILSLFVLPAPAQPRILDPNEVGLFLDSWMVPSLETLHVPGAAVVVTQDDRLLFSKGFGMADPVRRIPVDPDRTLFRIGSVTKCFTATAVLQLADKGRLELTDPVNRYAEFVSGHTNLRQGLASIISNSNLTTL